MSPLLILAVFQLVVSSVLGVLMHRMEPESRQLLFLSTMGAPLLLPLLGIVSLVLYLMGYK